MFGLKLGDGVVGDSEHETAEDLNDDVVRVGSEVNDSFSSLSTGFDQISHGGFVFHTLIIARDGPLQKGEDRTRRFG